MKKYSTIEELIRTNLSTNEDANTSKLMNSLKSVKIKGYFTKEEFLRMGMWKRPRPKRMYLNNSERDISLTSKEVFATQIEKRKINLLTSLYGVAIPTASAILTLTNPEEYGVIDIRVWKVLRLYGLVNNNSSGTNFAFNDWNNYLERLRDYSKKFNVSARDIERTLFLHHKEIQVGTLYKS
jgi:hypothetical protein